VRCCSAFIEVKRGCGYTQEADSLYEAVALAVAEFRRDEATEPGAMTEFTVTAFRRPTEHRIRLNQVTKWEQNTTKEGPAGVTKRERVREGEKSSRQ
jgi:hypothetical protein